VFNKWSANFAEFENGSGGLLSVFDAALKRLLQSWGFDDAKYLKSPRLEKPSIKPKQRITLEEKLSIPVNDPGLEAKRQTVLAELQKRLPSIEKLPGYTSKSKKKTTGRPGLSEEELFNRLSKAQEAVEKKAKDPKKSWRDIAMEIDWNWGKTPESEVKLLEEARKYLERFSYSDPDGIMKKFEKWKKTKKT
jgi:hypothetical protein